ncbi:MAG: serine hydrolase domain-containing protein [Actinomycetes bacterium]
MQTSQAVEVVTRHVDAAQRDLDVPGIAFGLLRDGELLHTGGVGQRVLGESEVPVANTVFRIASMTKSFTAAAVLLLRDRGVLRLDDDIAEHCPWMSGIGIPEGFHALTVRDLLTMQAGFPTDDPWGDRQEDLAIDAFDAMVASGVSFARSPRLVFEYSNLAYALLGRVISSATGIDYRDVVHAELLEPLGLSSTRFVAADVDAAHLAQGYAPTAAGLVPEPFTGPGAFSPMGGLLSTVEDLARWVAGFQNALSGVNDSHPLSRASRLEMQTAQKFIGTTLTRTPNDDGDDIVYVSTSSYCFGLRVSDDIPLGRFLSHSGGYPGFGSHMRWHVGTGWAVVGLGNRTYANMSATLTAALEEIVAGTQTRAVESELWPHTTSAMVIVESLLSEWNNEVADVQFAVNIDRDFPRTDRRADWQLAAEALGQWRRSDRAIESDSPAHARWWVEGDSGTAKLEVRLSPESPPKIQSLTVLLESAS